MAVPRLRRRCVNELLDVDHGRLALTLPLALYEADAGFPVQLLEQTDGFGSTALEILLDLVQRVVDIDPVEIVIPAVFSGQPHTVKQQPIKQLCVRGDLPVSCPGQELARDAAKRKALRLGAVEKVMLHVFTPLLAHRKPGSDISRRWHRGGRSAG